MGRSAQKIRQVLILFLQVFFFSGFIINCSRIDVEESDANIHGYPDVELFDAEIVYSQMGNVQFEVEASHIERFEINDLLLLKGGVKADLYNSNGEHTGRLTSEEGEVSEKQKHLLAHGNVIVESDSGLTLHADTLYYDSDLDRIRSDGFVIFVSRFDSLSGYGFISSTDLRDWEIKQASGATWREIETKKNTKNSTDAIENQTP